MMRLVTTAFALFGAIASAQAAGFDCTRFSKNPDGSWHANQPTEIYGPRGRIDFTPGESYKVGQDKLGLDIAKLLDANCDKK